MSSKLVIQDFHARRRIHNHQRWLIRHNYYVELDPVVDAVWLACTQPVSVAEIASSLATRGLLDQGDALAIVESVIAHFEREGFVRRELPDA